MSHHVHVTGLRPHTKSYSQEARETLGVAFMRAREVAGYPSRPAFVEASGVGKTSLYKLESGIPVSASVYEAAARALPNWTEDTPRLILEGSPPPPTTPSEESGREQAAVDAPPTYTELSEEDKVRVEMLKTMIDVTALKHEIRYQLLAYLIEAEGVEMTPRALQTIISEIDRLKSEQRSDSLPKVDGANH